MSRFSPACLLKESFSLKVHVPPALSFVDVLYVSLPRVSLKRKTRAEKESKTVSVTPDEQNHESAKVQAQRQQSQEVRITTLH